MGVNVHWTLSLTNQFSDGPKNVCQDQVKRTSNQHDKITDRRHSTCSDWLVKLKQTCNGIVGNDNSKVCVLVYCKQ